jgi:outer membrane protein assembly factor BamB
LAEEFIHTIFILGKQTGVLKYKGAVFSTPLIFGFNIVTALVINNENKTELIFYDFFNGKELKLIEIEGKVTNQMLKIGDDLILITENGIVKRINSKGSEIWSKQLSSFIHSTPAYSDGKIYFGNDAGEFIALDFESSEIILKKKIGDSFNSGVTIKNSLGYISDDKGTLYAINLKDASIKWSYETRARILMNAALDVENVFIANLAGSIFAINKNSGELVWTRNYNGEVFNSTPLITNNRVIISSLFKSVMILDKSNGEIKKEIELDNRAKLTPAIRHNILFIGYDNGNVRAYEILD